MEKAALCKTGLQNKEMPPLKSLEDSSIQIESMQTAFGQPPITETCQKSYIYCPSEVACPAQSGLYYCTMKRDSSSIWSKSTHREMHLLDAGDPGWTVLNFNAQEHEDGNTVT